MNVRREAIDVITSRRSVRRFRPSRVPAPIVRALLEAGRRAPSAHDSQPWKFAVVEGKERKETLAKAMVDSYARYLRRTGEEESRRLKKAYDRTSSAPLLIALSLDRSQLKKQPTRSRDRGEWVMGTQSVAAAAENMLLAAHACGIGGCWRGAPIFCGPAVRRALGLPRTQEPQVLLELGYPAETPRRKELKPKDEVVAYY